MFTYTSVSEDISGGHGLREENKGNSSTYSTHTLYSLLSHKVTLRPRPKFIPKVYSSFHMNQPIHLPTFYPKPHCENSEAILHTLDARRALAFYLDRTKTFRKCPTLFLSIVEMSKGTEVSSQRHFKVSNCIKHCYHVCNAVSSSGIHTHSMRLVSLSVTFLRNVPYLRNLQSSHLGICTKLHRTL